MQIFVNFFAINKKLCIFVLLQRSNGEIKNIMRVRALTKKEIIISTITNALSLGGWADLPRIEVITPDEHPAVMNVGIKNTYNDEVLFNIRLNSYTKEFEISCTQDKKDKRVLTDVISMTSYIAEKLGYHKA